MTIPNQAITASHYFFIMWDTFGFGVGIFSQLFSGTFAIPYRITQIRVP